jgi:uncharacterized membrane protein YccF (DUF307 family)
MENLSHRHSGFFRGAGWLIGLLVSIVCAIVVFTLSGTFSAAISAAIPIFVFAGTSIEKKLQGEINEIDLKKTRLMIASLLFGFLIFIALFIIVQLK